jgi:triphosphoribosyl-dephospho-CoA synthase
MEALRSPEWNGPLVPCVDAGEPSARARMLARIATFSLVEEATLTPKPGLVDQRGPGTHPDMSLALLLQSAHCLEPTFTAMALAAAHRIPSPELKAELAHHGRRGEAQMLAVTGGVNTHRGAIWALGLLVASAAMGRATSKTLASRAGRIACCSMPAVPQPPSHGVQIARRYGFAGARGEAREGFPHVIGLGLPALRKSRAQMRTESHARLDALLAIMAELDDTCLVFRGGLEALAQAKAGARHAVALGGSGTPAGYAALLRLDDAMARRGVSPGGSADLLAAVLFLDRIEEWDRSN